jgi:menaquinone-9 beta-reductase
VIVGGGIAGATLAYALARAGRSVLLLESTEVFQDRVRGESMMPWGVKEAQALGVADLLHAAGAHTARIWKRYSEGDPVPRDLPVGLLVPGVAGTLNLHHPLACQALLDAAIEAGAIVHRGTREVKVVAGINPVVSYRTQGQTQGQTQGRMQGRMQGQTHTVNACLVVGADGRGSAVRRSAGIRLQEQPATVCVAGMLLDGVAGNDDHDVIMEHDLGICLLIRQGGGRARAYQIVPIKHRARYSGDGGVERFLADATAPGSPLVDALAQARPAGPRGAIPGDDTWTDRPYADGVVLIGDAAGHNDPSVGCGLSIALRDARIVRDLILAGAHVANDFAPYGVERLERMRRMRLIGDVIAAAAVDEGEDRPARRRSFAKAMASMDAAIAPLVLGMFAGPETIPARLVSESAIARVALR